MKTYQRLLAIPIVYLFGYLVMQPYEWWMGPTLALAYVYVAMAVFNWNPFE